MKVGLKLSFLVDYDLFIYSINFKLRVPIWSVLENAPLKKGVNRKRAGKEEKENSCLSPQGEFCFSPLFQGLSTSFFQSALDFFGYFFDPCKKVTPARRGQVN
jgi:hypothetical protein